MRLRFLHFLLPALVAVAACGLDFDKYETGSGNRGSGSGGKAEGSSGQDGGPDSDGGDTGGGGDGASTGGGGADGAVDPDGGPGAVPDGCTPRQLYADRDGDGFGDPKSAIEACDERPGYVSEAKDCDDDCKTCFVGSKEDCDGKDNDCDDATDEKLTEDCGTDTGPCKKGEKTCDDGEWSACKGEIKPGDEVCDGKIDENCDGTSDEGCPCETGTTQDCGTDTDKGECVFGEQQCVASKWSADCAGAIAPVAETCNDKDDDCDDSIDEEITEDCGSDVGECEHGTRTCSAGTFSACSGGTTEATETCDNLDNDCDTSTDEQVARSCGPAAVGICRPGTETCTAGVWQTGCPGAVNAAAAEVCDQARLDENCNNSQNEGCACTNGMTEACGSDTGECSASTHTCTGGTWPASCPGSKGPATETCNGKDDNCNTVIDDMLSTDEANCGVCGNVCASGLTCNAGVCGPRVSAIYGGLTGSCALDAAGQLICWGYSEGGGSIAYGASGNQYTPTLVSGLGPFSKLSVGESHACGLRSNGVVRCWGNNQYQALGTTDISTYRDNAAPAGGVIDISAGSRQTCSVGGDGRVRCWGDRCQGRLGDSLDCNDDGYAYDAARTVGVISNATAVRAGANISCALTSNSQVYCWGYDVSTDLYIPELVRSNAAGNAILGDATRICAGERHACALRSGGSVVCWGRNDLGQLGNNSTNTPARSRYVAVSNLSNVTQIACGADSSCALTSSGAVSCWGDNLGGALGNGDTEQTESSVPVAVLSLGSNVTSVSVGQVGRTYFAVRRDGKVYGWGLNVYGTVGVGTMTTGEYAPVEVTSWP